MEQSLKRRTTKIEMIVVSVLVAEAIIPVYYCHVTMLTNRVHRIDCGARRVRQTAALRASVPTPTATGMRTGEVSRLDA